MPSCPIFTGDAAIAMVDQAYTTYSGFAGQTFQIAVEALGDLGDIVLKPVNFNVSYNISQALAGYERPERPDEIDVDFNVSTAPPLPPDISVQDVSFDAAPTTNASEPVLAFPPPPSEALPTPPGDAPPLSALVIPPAPTITYPDVPTLIELDIPAAPAITLPTFQGVRPSADLPIPINDFSFTAEEYASALLDKGEARISAMLDGGTGLPAAVAQALRDRAFESVDVQETRAVQQVNEEVANMGWNVPQGAQLGRLAQVRQENQNQRNALSRDIHIQDQMIAIENLRFAVTSCIAFEGQLISAHNELMRISLLAAQTAVDIKIRIFDARVNLYNAQVQAYAIDAQVFRSLIEAELAKLEVFKAQIDAERLKGEINEQRVRIYSERIRAVVSMVEVYKVQLEAVRVQAEANTQVIEGYRATVQAYAERVRAQVSVYDGYRARVEAELAKVRVYEVTTNAYATGVKAWSDIQSARVQQQDARVKERELRLRGWEGQVRAFEAQNTAEAERIRASVSVYGGRVALYQADAAIETAASDSNQRQFDLMMQQERARVDTSLEQARVDVQQMVQLLTLAVQREQAIAQIAGNLSAASMSAVNFSAGVSSSRGQSQGCNTNFSYTGTIE